MVGAHAFADNRLGLWAIENSSLTDKLKHVLPRLRGPFPNMTDIFLPPSATLADRQLVRDNNFFVNVYATANQKFAAALADEGRMAQSILGGTVEFNVELPNDDALRPYITDLMKRFRKFRPNMKVRINVAPYKGYRLPVELFVTDPNLHVIVQAYYGNMEGRLSEFDVVKDLLIYGMPLEKIQVMYGVANDTPDAYRQYSLPNPGYKPLRSGSIFSDDLLLGAGLV